MPKMLAVQTNLCDIKETDFHDDLEIIHSCTDDSEQYFFKVIGCIEDIVMDSKFANLQHTFLEKYWSEFEDGEENKLIYMNIFYEYIQTVEKYIESELIKLIPDFEMELFEKELRNKKNELEGEIFEILLTFSDFNACKSMFLDYKAVKEGQVADFSQAIIVTKCN